MEKNLLGVGEKTTRKKKLRPNDHTNVDITSAQYGDDIP
jgi:hypothetical protein